ncbi:MAG: hypothetical protein EP318_06145 [Rhodobacteraceae bacterium]|nr:MAG: hypothetical protein EP318_06145 [Paracoccaceae bacterium]
MKTLLQIRASDARALSEGLSGVTDVHPHGLSGRRHLLPKFLTSDCWDTAPAGLLFSEWGNAAGICQDLNVEHHAVSNSQSELLK